MKSNNKKKIEEEAYREQVRASMVSAQKPKSSSGIPIILILFVILFAAIVISVNPSKQLEQADQLAKSTQQAGDTLEGSFYALNGSTYNYDILHDDAEDKYTVTFSPFLPRDDNTLFLAMQEVFKTVYGSDAADIATRPTILEKNGTNILQFSSTYSNYYVLPIKQDTGEIHSVTLWKE